MIAENIGLISLGMEVKDITLAAMGGEKLKEELRRQSLVSLATSSSQNTRSFGFLHHAA